MPAEQTVYLSGASDFLPLLQEMAPVIVRETGLRPVFKVTSSCVGARSMNPASPSYASDHFIRDPVVAADSYAQIFMDSGPSVNCLLGPTGVPVDVGESGIAPETCGGVANNPDQVSESLGPIVPFVLVVPPTSLERAISFAAARQVFGGGGGVAPWEDPNRIFIRGPGNDTLQLVAKELELTPTQVWGIDQGSASALVANLAAVADPTVAQSAIGILAGHFYDAYRGNVLPLAYQAKEQSCAYLPDSNLATTDKANVRDGHYPLWGRIHFFTARANGAPVSDAADQVVYLLTTRALNSEILTAVIRAGLVPPCAMAVVRETELGPLISDNEWCGCFFDAQVSAFPGAECSPCVVNSDCPATRPYCRYGYCEPTW